MFQDTSSHPQQADDPQATDLRDQAAARFGEVVHEMAVKLLQYKTGTLSSTESSVVESMVTGRMPNEALSDISNATSQLFWRNILDDYFRTLHQTLGQDLTHIRSLGFDLKSATILVWATVSDDRLDVEHALYTVEAVVNGMYTELGYSIDTMVTEVQDLIPLPSQYVKVLPSSPASNA